ncbi:hypothetical protein K439DRAFT_770448 [Ramaria rubella]|nr:hypothetical protein K439DRAFT_770448 [Ramaria rubella]
MSSELRLDRGNRRLTTRPAPLNHQCIKVPPPASPEQFESWVEECASDRYICAWPGCPSQPEYHTRGRVCHHIYAEHRYQSPFVCIIPRCGKVFARAHDAMRHCTTQ